MKNAGLFALLCGLLGLAAPGANADSFVVELPASSWSVRDDKGIAVFSTSRLTVEPGKPALPRQDVQILLPPDADPASVIVTMDAPVYETIAGQWDIRPSAPFAHSDEVYWPATQTIRDGRDVDVYENAAYYPSSPLIRVSAGQRREYKLAQVPVVMARYNPVTKVLQALRSGRLSVTYTRLSALSSMTGSPANIRQELEEEIAASVCNYAQFGSWYNRVDQGGTLATQSGEGYVIITRSEIQSSSSQLASFVAAKQAAGYTVTVVTEATWGGGTGNTAAENIRTWLAANYQTMGLTYVLLIGNPHPTTGTVPMKMCYPQDYDPNYPEAPTDYYYAELTGDWDLDNDNRYGEYNDDYGSGGAGTHTEVIVGRIPYYSDVNNLDSILQKLVAYQVSTDTAWRARALLPMEPSDSLTPGYHLGEAIKTSVLSPEGWSWHRVYEQSYGLSPAPETTPCSVDNVRKAWTNNPPGAAFWWTHGNETYAADVMDLSSVSLLNNNKPAFVFQCSCLNAYPEFSNNLSYSLLLNGSICAISATRVSWYSMGQTDYEGTASNSGMTYEYAKRLIGEEMTCGRALHDLKSSVVPTHPAFWMNYLDFNVYGCPAMGLAAAAETPPPVPPTGVTASDGTFSNKVAVSWSVVTNATLYRIYRNTQATTVGANLLGTSVTNFYDDETAALGTLYYYWVKASDGTQDSAFSAYDSGYRQTAGGGPGTPAWVTASDGLYSDRVRVDWADTFGATHYRVSRSTSAGGIKTNVTGWITERYCNDTATLPGVSYYYLVQAASDAEGSNPGTVSAEDRGYRGLLPPSSVTATRGTYSDKIVVNWSESTGATHYCVFRESVPTQLNRTAVSSWITNRVYTNAVALSVQGTNAFYYSVQAATNSAGASPSAFSAETIGQLGLPLDTMPAPVASDGVSTGPVQITWSLVTSGTHYRLARASTLGGSKSYLTGWTNLVAWSDSGATPGASFYYSIQAATDGVGSRASTNSTEDEGWRRIAPPLNFTASEDRTNMVYLSWNAPSGAARYQIARGTSEGGSKTELTGWISGTTYNDTNTPVAVPLYYTVTAAMDTNGYRPSNPSAEDRGWISLPPVTGIVASDGTSTAHVSVVWNALDGASHYGVFRATSSSGAKTNVSTWLAAMTNFNDTTATSGVSYYYWVQGAVDDQGTGAGAFGTYDEGWRAFPGPVISASDGDYTDRVQVSWPAVTGATYYRVYYVVDNVWTTLSSWISVTGYSHSAAAPGTDYWYTVQAANGSGGSRAGDLSDSNAGWRALSAPATITATDGTYSNLVRIAWSPSVNATRYKVYRADVGSAVSELSAWIEGTNYDDATAYPGASYFYSVRSALNDAGYRPSAQSVSNEGWRALLAPSPVVASDDLYTDRVEVTWGSVEGASTYQLYRMTSTGQASRTALTGWTNVLGYVDTAASPGVQYYYSVKAATNSAGARSSPFSDEDPGRRSLNAVAPGASDGTYSDRIQINWASVVGASRYQVWRADSPSGDLAPLTGWINATSYDDRTVIPGQDYAYAIQASVDTNGNVVGAMGDRDTGWRSLPAPVWLSVTEGDSPLRVSLAAVKGASVYRLYRASSTSTTQWQNIVGWTNSTDIADPDAWPGVSGYYWVQAALDTNGTRAGNVSAYAIGWAPLSPPSDLTASEGLYTNRVLLAWSAAPSSTHHKVYRMRAGGDTWEQITGWLAATNHGDTSAVPGLVYSYSVVAARDSAGSRASQPSPSQTGWRTLAPPVEIVAGDGMLAAGVRVEWMGSSGASAYRVYRADVTNGPFNAIGAWGTNLTYLDSAPVPGSSHYYAVEAACDDAGLRPSGLSTADIGWRAVSQPTPVAATDGTLTNLVRISWSNPTGATRYRLYRAAVADGTRTDLTGWTPDQTFDDTNAATGVEYIYEVRAAADSNGWHTGLYGAEDTGWAAAVGVPSADFRDWADAHGLTGDLQTIFISDRDGDGLPNGLEYALGTNRLVGEPILTVKLKSGTAVAETTKQDGSTSPEVSVAVEASLSLMTNAWSLPVVHFFGDGIPGNREQWQPQSAATGAVFRLKAVLQP